MSTVESFEKYIHIHNLKKNSNFIVMLNSGRKQLNFNISKNEAFLFEFFKNLILQ